MYNHSKVLSGSTTYTLLPMGLKFQPGDNTGNKSYLQHSSKHHERLIEIFSAQHWLGSTFSRLLSISKKIFSKALLTINFYIKEKSCCRKILAPRWTQKLKKIIKLLVPKLSQIYLNVCPCMSTEHKITELKGDFAFPPLPLSAVWAMWSYLIFVMN